MRTQRWMRLFLFAGVVFLHGIAIAEHPRHRAHRPLARRSGSGPGAIERVYYAIGCGRLRPPLRNLPSNRPFPGNS